MAPIKLFRQGNVYAKKLMRLGAAMRRYSEYHLPKDQNFNSLALEVDALEELSLSAFSLMKAIKQELADAATRPSTSCSCGSYCAAVTCLCRCHKVDKKPGMNFRSGESCIIRPFSAAYNDADEDDK